MKDPEMNLNKTGMNRELFILEAVYTDGLTHIPVTQKEQESEIPELESSLR